LPQFYDSDGFAAAFFGFGGVGGDERVGAEKFGEATAEGAGAVAVDDANGGEVSEGGVVEEFVDVFGGLFDGLANDVDFVGGGRTRRRGDGRRSRAPRISG
jgi:hypothetical protein